MPVGFLKNAQIPVQGSYAACRLVWVGMHRKHKEMSDI